MSDAGRPSSIPPEKFGESQRSGSAGSGTETSSEKSLEITAEDPDEIITPQISRRSLPSLSKKVTSVGTTGTTDPNFEVDWDENDPANPRNWPLRVKGMSTAFLSWSTFTV